MASKKAERVAVHLTNSRIRGIAELSSIRRYLSEHALQVRR